MNDRFEFGITAETLEEYRQACQELQEHLEQLAELTQRYPVTCVFGNYRTVFENREQIEEVIEALKSELEGWVEAA